MKPTDPIYRRLQRHLDRQAVGFPATRSGVELRILEHIFTPREAELAAYLSYRFEPLAAIHEKARHVVATSQELEASLDAAAKKGGLEVTVRNGVKHYCCIPLVVGMYEFQNRRLTPEFRKAVHAYFSEPAFGLSFLSTPLPQMRTIPVGKSIRPGLSVSRFDAVRRLLQEADGPFAVVDCICRKQKALEGAPCCVTDRRETCLGVGHLARMSVANGLGREIERDEAIAIIEQNQDEGLVLQPSNTQKAEFICSCCGCCCGMLQAYKRLPRPLDFWAANYYAVVDEDACSGCGACENACQVDAVRVAEVARIDRHRCLGCGNCAVTCPTGAVALARRSDERVPPRDREELYHIIMHNKKGPVGRMLVTGRLIVDWIRARAPGPFRRTG